MTNRAKSKSQTDEDKQILWPSSGHTRIPCDVYLDQGIFEKEQELIFNGSNMALVGYKR